MIGQTLGHYRVLEKIGAGGMGVVYRARDERLERDVALKVLPTNTFAHESASKRFRKEALSLSRLNHPNIATVHDFDAEAGVHFIVLELIAGMTLREKLTTHAEKRRNRVPLEIPCLHRFPERLRRNHGAPSGTLLKAGGRLCAVDVGGDGEASRWSPPT